jgi:hypothetical protein
MLPLSMAESTRQSRQPRAPLAPDSITLSESDAMSMRFLKELTNLWTKTFKVADFLLRDKWFNSAFFVGWHGRNQLLKLIIGCHLMPKRE